MTSADAREAHREAVRQPVASATAGWLFIIALTLVAALMSPAIAMAAPPTKAEVARQKAEQLEQRVVEKDEVAPAPAEIQLTQEGTQAVDPRGQAPLDDAISCLARSIYWEAKGTDQREMQAVANVIMNRLGNPEFPSSLCGVVQQGSESGRCQFSWWCDGRPDEADEPRQYAAAREVARRALNGTLPDITRGAQFFHHRSIGPGWMSTLVRTTQTQEFSFYRLPG